MSESSRLPVPTKVEDIGSYLVQQGKPTNAGKRMLSVLPFSNEMERQRFLNVGMEVSRNAALTNCTPVSVLIAMMDVAKVGLSLNPNLGEAAIVPFSGKAKMITGYKGYETLARRGKLVTSIEVYLVHENDQFPVGLGLRTAMQRWAPWDVVRAPNSGKLLGGFCRAIVLGAEQFHWATVEDFERAKAASASWRSKGENSAWGTDYKAMCKKTIIRRAAAQWPQTDEMGRAQAQEAEAEEEKPAAPRHEFTAFLADAGFDIPQEEEEVIDADFSEAEEPEPPAPEDAGFEDVRRGYNALTADQKKKVLAAAKIANISEVRGDKERTAQLDNFICDVIGNK